MTGLERLRENAHEVADATSVLAVVAEMERHISGIEWMQDSPVARWARKLRESVKGATDVDEDADTAKWVREHGGLEKIEMSIHEADNMRAELCVWLGIDENTSWGRAVIELDRRLMPPGMEWPRFEDDGEKVCLHDEFMGKDGKTYIVNEAKFIGKCFSLFDFCDRKPQFTGFYGERVKRPKLAPVGADGVPLKVGETVFDLCNNKYVVDSFYKRLGITMVNVHKRGCDDIKSIWANCLTHTKPEPLDSWEKIYSDCELTGEQYVEERMDEQPDDMTPEMAMALDLVSRAKALAERERGE